MTPFALNSATEHLETARTVPWLFWRLICLDSLDFVLVGQSASGGHQLVLTLRIPENDDDALLEAALEKRKRFSNCRLSHLRSQSYSFTSCLRRPPCSPGISFQLNLLRIN
ncbi:hypothetical protein AVEN_31187-1 [Araneus ventricosus]|uniref:Uncharacterized protein n=1 Tax=Araneus ventricosus TaxID=182803 RepID=A0A4Y2KLR6_ARAVE|nr:hypothetical protein AVEN_31187-1 [Araneus ventricosus]